MHRSHTRCICGSFAMAYNVALSVYSVSASWCSELGQDSIGWHTYKVYRYSICIKYIQSMYYELQARQQLPQDHTSCSLMKQSLPLTICRPFFFHLAPQAAHRVLWPLQATSSVQLSRTGAQLWRVPVGGSSACWVSSLLTWCSTLRPSPGVTQHPQYSVSGTGNWCE